MVMATMEIASSSQLEEVLPTSSSSSSSLCPPPPIECEYFPTHLVHGILAEHCASETGNIAGNSPIKKGQPVRISEINPTYQAFKKRWNNTSINSHLQNWLVLKVLDDSYTGYLGIIYVNDKSRQIVLAHRSTNFSLSLTTKNFFEQSGVHQDVEGVLMGNILLHQAYGYLATQDAVEFVKNQPQYKKYSLSFTGHSLGAWLAALSVLYCHDDFNYEFSQAITFDGPGPFEMMQKLRQNSIVGPNSQTRLEDLDIVSYLSAPNLVNCVYHHVGIVYTILPIDVNFSMDENEDRQSVRLMNKLKQFIWNQIPGPIRSTYGHHFKFMLPYFGETNAGRPKSFKRVVNWPSIGHSDFGKHTSSKFSVTSKALSFLTSRLPVGAGVKLNLTTTGINIPGVARGFAWESTTLDSLAHIALEYYAGKINLEQLWLVHEFLDKNRGFIETPGQSRIDLFCLRYQASYKVEQVDHTKAIKTGSKIDKCLKLLYKLKKDKKSREKLQGKALRDFVDKYEVVDDTISIQSQFQTTLSIDSIRNQIRNFFRGEINNFEEFITNIHKARLKGNLETYPPLKFLPQINLENISTFNCDALNILDMGYKVTIIKGMTGRGKTTLVKSYALEYKTEFTARFLEADSKEGFDKYFNECIKSIDFGSTSNQNDSSIIPVVNHLKITKQQVVFVFDDTNSNTLDQVLDFIAKFEDLMNVRFVITTQDDNLLQSLEFLVSGFIPQISMEYLSNEQIVYDRVKQQLTLRRENEMCKNILKLLCILKSGQITREELIGSLALNLNLNLIDGFDYGHIQLLRKFSFLTIDSNNRICTNDVIRMISVEFYSSFEECFLFLSSIRPIHAHVDFIFEKITTFSLSSEIGLRNVLNVEQKCNLVYILTKLLEYLNSRDWADVILLQNIQEMRNQFVTNSDEVLQSFMTELSHDWTQAHLQGQTGIFDYFQQNALKLKDVLELFNSFGKRVKKGYELTDDGLINGDLSDYEHIVVIGQTGSGKSTFINYQIGHELTCNTAAGHGRQAQVRVNKKVESPVAQIGSNQAISETDSIQPYYSKEFGSNVVYWDFPGFGDSRGETHNIELAYLLKSFSQIVKHFKILFVLSDSQISKENRFETLVHALSRLCSREQICNNLALLITKGDSFSDDETADEDKASYKGKFAAFLNARRGRSYEWVLELLTHITPERTAFFPKLTCKGKITHENFVDLDVIEKTQVGQIQFNLSIDEVTNGTIETLTHLLNQYAIHVIKLIIKGRVDKIKKILQADTFTKESLYQTEGFSIQSLDPVNFLTQLKSTTTHDEKEFVRILGNIIETIELFQELNQDCSPNLVTWIIPFKEFDDMYENLISPTNIIPSNSECILEIRAVIMTSTEIQDLYERNRRDIESIRCCAYIIVIDSNLVLPGINLSVACQIFVISGDDKLISLKGGHDQMFLNSGNFYGHANLVRGGQISFDLDGVDGKNGQFGSIDIDNKIREIDREIEETDSKLADLKTVAINGPIQYEKELKLSEARCLRNIQNLQDERLVLRQSLSNFMTERNSTPQDDDRRMADYEEHIAKEKINLENIKSKSESITELKLIIATDHYDYLKMTTKKYVIDGAFESIEQQRTESIKLIREEISKINDQFREVCSDQELNAWDKYGKIKILWSRSELLSNDLKILKDEWEKEERERETKGDMVERYSIIIENNIPVDMTEDELKVGLKDIIHTLEVYRKNLIKKKESHSTQKKKLGSDMDNYNEQYGLRKDFEREKEFLRNDLVQKRRILETIISSELFGELKEKINDLTKTIEKREQTGKLFGTLLAQKDITLPGSIEKYVATQRELLIIVDDHKIGKMEEKENLQSKIQPQETYEDICKNLQMFMQVKTCSKLAEIKLTVNDLIDQNNLENCSRYPSPNENNGDSDNDFENCKKELRKLWESSRWFFKSKRSGRLDDGEIEKTAQDHCTKQQNLTKRHEFAQTYTQKLESARAKFKQAIEQYQLALKHYKEWKQRYLSGPINQDVKTFIESFDEFSECELNLKNAFNKETKIVKKLLLKNSNMIERIEVGWEDKKFWGKFGYVLKEIFLFTRQFYEKYRVCGSEGTEGGNSGDYMFAGGIDDHVQNLTQKPGEGGRHACVLEGTYLGEYAFPMIRGIKEKQNSVDGSSILSLKGYLGAAAKTAGSLADDVAFAMLAREIPRLATTSGLSLLLVAASIPVSYGVELLNSDMVDGPYRTMPVPAKNGKKGVMNSQEEFMVRYRNYIEQSISNEVKNILS